MHVPFGSTVEQVLQAVRALPLEAELRREEGAFGELSGSLVAARSSYVPRVPTCLAEDAPVNDKETLLIFELDDEPGTLVRVLPRTVKAKANAFFAESLEAVPFGHPLILRVASGASGHALYQRVWEEVRAYMAAVPEAGAAGRIPFPFMLHPVTDPSGVQGWERPVLPDVENPRLHVDSVPVDASDKEPHGLADGEHG